MRRFKQNFLQCVEFYSHFKFSQPKRSNIFSSTLPVSLSLSLSHSLSLSLSPYSWFPSEGFSSFLAGFFFYVWLVRFARLAAAAGGLLASLVKEDFPALVSVHSASEKKKQYARQKNLIGLKTEVF